MREQNRFNHLIIDIGDKINWKTRGEVKTQKLTCTSDQCQHSFEPQGSSWYFLLIKINDLTKSYRHVDLGKLNG